jgi:hypothetical protein
MMNVGIDRKRLSTSFEYTYPSLLAHKLEVKRQQA